MRAGLVLVPIALAGILLLAWRGRAGGASVDAGSTEPRSAATELARGAPPSSPSAGTSASAPVGKSASSAGATIEPDVFHPAHQPGADGKRPPLPKPAYGGRATIHLERLPRTLNNVVENQGVIRRVMYEVHETLLLRDWETMEWRPNLAREWWVEDAVHLKPGTGHLNADSLPTGQVLHGRITTETSELIRMQVLFDDEEIDENGRRVRDRGTAPALPEAQLLVDTNSVLHIERGTVLTFRLRDDVKWHDGHPFDARDVVFSLELYANPLVDCGERRPQFAGIVKVEALDPHTVRVWYDTQSYYRLTALGSELTILPAHLYDLTHPDNVEGNAKRKLDPNWKPTQAESAEFINKNPHNRAFVGLGPYKLTRFDDQGVLVERNPLYFDREHAGYLDSIFWRYVKDDGAAFQALLNGELDFFARMSADDYFGPATASETFTKTLFKGHYYSGNYWFTAWNLRRPQLADVRVREAIARAFDFEGFKTATYKGLADVVTGPWMLNRPEYNHAVLPYPRDPAKARALLEDAGWIDRDGDGVVDKDGVKLAIELLSDSGNAISKAFAAKLQEDLKAIGIALTFTALDSKAVDERKKARDFDAVALAWALGFETDPEQVWHSRGAAADAKSANFGGFADERCDALIEAGQKELDPEQRAAIWRALHARIYELQPYLFAYSPPRKFGMNAKLFGLQLVPQDPNYVVRRWYYAAGTPGTRATPETK